MNRHIQTFHKEEDEEKSNNEMENDRANESSDESSDEEDVQTQGSEADQLDAHLEKNEVFRQWLPVLINNSRTGWLTEIVMSFLRLNSQSSCFRTLFSFIKKC